MYYRLLVTMFCLLLLPFTVGAEVQQVTIRWTSLLCKDSCVKLLDQQLKKISGIKDVSIDQQAGQAVLTWKPNAPFLFTSINSAMHMVGISMRDIRIRVQGSIRHSGSTIFIVSEGDNTRFELVSPVTPNSKGQTSEYNYSNRKLSPDLMKQLLDAEKNRLKATIEGPVFMPERMTVPTQIVVDKLDFAETPKTK